MSAADTLIALKNWSDQLVHEVVDQLNDIGIVSDEDEHGFDSSWVEYWDDECTQYLRQAGYEGGPLGRHGKHFSNYGSAYALFDENEHDLKSAEKYLASKIDSP